MKTYGEVLTLWEMIDIYFDTPIDKKNGYIEGVGQLCVDCYLDLLNPGRKNRQENEE